MGKNKHKKHHRHDDDEDGTEGGDGPRTSGLKLILKVGGTSGSSRDKHKKKKKKKDKKKYRERHGDREGSNKDRHHKKHHRHSSDKRDKHAAMEMLKTEELQLQQPHIPSLTPVVNQGGESGSLMMHSQGGQVVSTTSQGSGMTGIVPSTTSSSDGFSKIPVSVDGNTAVGHMALMGVGNAGMVSAPPSVVVTPKVETAAVKSEEEMASQEKKHPNNKLSRFQDYLLKLLQKKDSNNFFAVPVNDQFAPGYSQVIKTPMDFSTIRLKVVGGSYTTLSNFKQDFELMCTNAMTYNTQDTIYYKSAKKLLGYGRKILSVEKIQLLQGHLPFTITISPEEFGFDMNSDSNEAESPTEASAEGKSGDRETDRDTADSDADSESDDDADVSRVIEDIREVVRRPPGRFEAIPDNLTAQEIADQAAAAAKGAAEKLKNRRKGSKMGFLRQRPDGTTSLNIITGESGVIPGTEKDRPVLLGSLLGKVKQGTGSIQGFREDRRNVSKAVYPLYYGAYSSHGPTYDSTFANLTKEETEMIYNTYGDTVGVQYAESILNFSRNCDYAMFIVDHLLDILTGNEHRKTSHYIAEQKMLRREDDLLESTYTDLEDLEQQQTTENQHSDTSVEENSDTSVEENHINFDALKSLSTDFGIDMSFIDTMKKEYDDSRQDLSNTSTSSCKALPKLDEKTSKDLQDKIQKNAELIQELKDVQNERLSSTPPVHFSNISKPNDREQELASVIRTNLVDMAGKVKPYHITSERNIRNAMGTSENLPLSSTNTVNTMQSAVVENNSENSNIIKEQPMEIN